MSSAPVLYFDLGSPYAYLALERAPAVLGCEPELEPVLLGAIFARRGFGSWARTDARAPRMGEVEARAAQRGLPPLRWPERWPTDGLMAMRCATWARQQGAALAFARSAFRAQFQHGRDISEAAVVAACARESGLDADEMARAIAGAAVKDALRSATERAWDAGVRGVPSLLVAGAVFYGDDQLELAAAAGEAAGCSGAAPSAP